MQCQSLERKLTLHFDYHDYLISKRIDISNLAKSCVLSFDGEILLSQHCPDLLIQLSKPYRFFYRQN